MTKLSKWAIADVIALLALIGLLLAIKWYIGVVADQQVQHECPAWITDGSDARCKN